jgi:hypothetical protein
MVFFFKQTIAKISKDWGNLKAPTLLMEIENGAVTGEQFGTLLKTESCQI